MYLKHAETERVLIEQRTKGAMKFKRFVDWFPCTSCSHQKFAMFCPSAMFSPPHNGSIEKETYFCILCAAQVPSLNSIVASPFLFSLISKIDVMICIAQLK